MAFGTDLELGMPFGGHKQLGNGRESGYAGLDDCLEIESISCAVAPSVA